MATNLPVAFAEIVTGAILALTGVSQSGSLSDTLKGNFTFGLGSLGGSSGNSSSSTSATTASSSSVAVGKVTSSDLNSIGAKKGWNAAEIEAWSRVINKESGGNPQAKNPSSGAAGIAQFINGYSEYAQYGGNADTVTGQLTAMANYIQQRYKTPLAAWEHEVQYNWY